MESDQRDIFDEAERYIENWVEGIDREGELYVRAGIISEEHEEARSLYVKKVFDPEDSDADESSSLDKITFYDDIELEVDEWVEEIAENYEELDEERTRQSELVDRSSD